MIQKGSNPEFYVHQVYSGCSLKTPLAFSGHKLSRAILVLLTNNPIYNAFSTAKLDRHVLGTRSNLFFTTYVNVPRQDMTSATLFIMCI